MNTLGNVRHRRDALWQIGLAGRPTGSLLKSIHTDSSSSERQIFLQQMTTEERLQAGCSGTGLTTGPHPMEFLCAGLRVDGVVSATELALCSNNRFVHIVGCAIARQRPGTAKGFVFFSLEDETGIANIILQPAIFERDRTIVTRSRFLRIAGPVQNQDGVIHVKAMQIRPFTCANLETRSRDFH